MEFFAIKQTIKAHRKIFSKDLISKHIDCKTNKKNNRREYRVKSFQWKLIKKIVIWVTSFKFNDLIQESFDSMINILKFDLKLLRI